VQSEIEKREDYLAKIQELKELILQCLQDIPEHRLSINSICNDLRKVMPQLKLPKIEVS